MNAGGAPEASRARKGWEQSPKAASAVGAARESKARVIRIRAGDIFAKRRAVGWPDVLLNYPRANL
jgi:hypothetical protein